ncbi:MAG: right-handed parallel beta-helix repeat-containing protein, partial [Bacteroidota bacterium]
NFDCLSYSSPGLPQNFYPSLEAVNIPSDCHLSMSENTNLRIFPGGSFEKEGGAILAVRDAENIRVTGGNLFGDREERIFSPEDTGLEGSRLLEIHSGRNIEVDGVNFENGSAGTISIFSFGFPFNPDYNPTTGVTVKNCIMKNSRRMAIALTDARDVLIEGNAFINTGQPSANTDGGEVGYAINIEPYRTRNDAGEIVEYQRVFDVMVRKNTESGSRGGFLTLTIGQDITVEDNDIGTRLVYSFVSGVSVKNNRFKAVGEAAESWAIFCAGSGETVFDNEVSGNKIEGYQLGIVVGSEGADVHHNQISNGSSGIQLSKARGARVHKNTIDVDGNGIQATNTNLDGVEISENEVITSGNFNIYFAQMNHLDEHSNQTVMIKENVLKGSKAVIFSNVSGVSFNRNEVNGGVSVGNVLRTNLIANTIRPGESSGIRLYETHDQVIVSDNEIYEPTGADRYVCLQNDSTTPDEVEMAQNTCNE